MPGCSSEHDEQIESMVGGAGFNDARPRKKKAKTGAAANAAAAAVRARRTAAAEAARLEAEAKRLAEEKAAAAAAEEEKRLAEAQAEQARAEAEAKAAEEAKVAAEAAPAAPALRETVSAPAALEHYNPMEPYNHSLAEQGLSISLATTSDELQKIVTDQEFVKVINSLKTSPLSSSATETSQAAIIFVRYSIFIKDPPTPPEGGVGAGGWVYIRDPNSSINIKYVLASKDSIQGHRVTMGDKEVNRLINELEETVMILYPQHEYDVNHFKMVVEGAIHDSFNDAIVHRSPAPVVAVNPLVVYNIDILAGATINYIKQSIMANKDLVFAFGIELISIYTTQKTILGRLVGLAFIINYFKIKGDKLGRVLTKIIDGVMKMIGVVISVTTAGWEVISEELQNYALRAAEAINKKAEGVDDEAQKYRTQYANGINDMFKNLHVDDDMKTAVTNMLNTFNGTTPPQEEEVMNGGSSHAGGAPKRTTKKHTKKGKTKMLKGKSKKHLKKLKKSKKGKKTGKKVRFHSASKKSKKTTRKRR